MDPSLLFMSVREYQYDVALSELTEYLYELEATGFSDRSDSDYEKIFTESVISQMIAKVYDEKIRWESSGKSFLVMSPVEIISKFYDVYERGIEKATTLDSKEIFQIAYRVSGEILERFL